MDQLLQLIYSLNAAHNTCTACEYVRVEVATIVMLGQGEHANMPTSRPGCHVTRPIQLSCAERPCHVTGRHPDVML